MKLNTRLFIGIAFILTLGAAGMYLGTSQTAIAESTGSDSVTQAAQGAEACCALEAKAAASAAAACTISGAKMSAAKTGCSEKSTALKGTKAAATDKTGGSCCKADGASKKVADAGTESQKTH